MNAQTTPGVYVAIASVMQDLAANGISKSRKNQQQGYNFRGIDDVYNALAPILSRHGLVILPRVLSREQTERTTAKGGVLFYTTVEVEFDLVARADGSLHTVKTYGEAMDSGDKSTNKAMSAAFKYAAMQAFCIPTEGDNDADATTHEIRPSARPQPATRSLADRAEGLIDAINSAPNAEELEKAWSRGAGLCAQLDTSDPDLLATVELARQAREAHFDGNPFAVEAA